MEGKERLAAVAVAAALFCVLGFLWSWARIHPRWPPWRAGSDSASGAQLALALLSGSGPGSRPFASSINSSSTSSLLHPLTHLSPHFTSPSPPLFSLSLSLSALSISALSISFTLLPPSPRPPSHFSPFRLHFSRCWPLFPHASRGITHPPPPPPPLSHRSATLDPAIPPRVHDRRKKIHYTTTTHPHPAAPAFSSILPRPRITPSVDVKVSEWFSFLVLALGCAGAFQCCLLRACAHEFHDSNCVVRRGSTVRHAGLRVGALVFSSSCL